MQYFFCFKKLWVLCRIESKCNFYAILGAKWNFYAILGAPGYIMLEGIMMDMICKIDPSYHDKVIWRKDGLKKPLCGWLNKAVYRTLLGAIIFYNYPLIMGADKSGTLTWIINASFVVHPDCKCHTGACLTLGYGSMLSLSSKQKINTKSSTKAKLVGVHDAMTFVKWMKHFLNHK